LIATLAAALALAVLPVAALPPAALATAPTEASQGPRTPACDPHGAMEVADPAPRAPVLLYRQDGRVTRSRLVDLPKANHEKTVLRSVDGCAAPLVVTHGVGR